MIRKAAPRAEFLLALLGLLAFTSAWGNGVTNWDDPTYFVENRLVHGLSWERISAAFSQFYFSNYNPLHLVSYMVDHELWSLEPRGVLAGNIVLHVAAGLLAYRALRLLGLGRNGAFFAAAVFLVHPTRCESVVWLSERKDVLSGFFAAACVVAHCTALDREAAMHAPTGLAWRWRALALALFVLGLLSKTQILPLPLALLAVDFFKRRPMSRSTLALAPALALALAAGLVTLKAHAGDDTLEIATKAGTQWSALKPLAAVPHYLLTLTMPTTLSPVYPQPPSLGLRAVAGALLFGLAAVAAIASARRKRGVFAAIAWIVVLSAPVSGVVANPVFAADRYLYLAILGPAALLGHWVERRTPQRAQRPIIAIACLAMAALTAQYAPTWRDSGTLWRRVLRVDPGSSLARSNLGMHELSLGHPNAARRLFEEDLATLPRYPESVFGLSQLLRAEGRVDEALRIQEELLESKQVPSRAVLSHAAFLGELDRVDEALAKISRFGPRPTFALHQTLFRLHFQAGRIAEAERHASLSVALNPFHEEGWYHLALAQERLGRPLDAARSLERAIERTPAFSPAHEALARILYQEGQPAASLDALSRSPTKSAAGWNLAALSWFALGETQRSVEAIDEALRLLPQSVEYRSNRNRIVAAASAAPND